MLKTGSIPELRRKRGDMIEIEKLSKIKIVPKAGDVLQWTSGDRKEVIYFVATTVDSNKNIIHGISINDNRKIKTENRFKPHQLFFDNVDNNAFKMVLRAEDNKPDNYTFDTMIEANSDFIE